MDRVELAAFRKIARWTIASYVFATFVTLVLGLDSAGSLLG